MKGIESAEKLYYDFFEKTLKTEFCECFPRVAAGLVGHGSECFGFDDDASADHDFDGGFCVWITDADEKKYGFKLFRAYEALIKEQGVKSERSARGGNFKGIKTIGEFYKFYLGTEGAPKTNAQWMSIPDHYLAEATNGKVFYDGLGEFTRVRNALLYDRPEDVRLKKLASALIFAAQYGQYNYARCFAHGEREAAALAAAEFAKNALYAGFLLERRYAPYYKWCFRAMRQTGAFGGLCDTLKDILSSPFDHENNVKRIDAAAGFLIKRLVFDGYCGDKGDYLEPYAYAVNDLIADADLRNSPVMI